MWHIFKGKQQAIRNLYGPISYKRSTRFQRHRCRWKALDLRFQMTPVPRKMVRCALRCGTTKTRKRLLFSCRIFAPRFPKTFSEFKTILFRIQLAVFRIRPTDFPNLVHNCSWFHVGVFWIRLTNVFGISSLHFQDMHSCFPNFHALFRIQGYL